VPCQYMRSKNTWPQFLALGAPRCSILAMNGDCDVVVDELGTRWNELRKNVARANEIYRALGNADGIQVWFESGGGHRPYPLRKKAIKWLDDRIDVPELTNEEIGELEEINYSDWAKAHHIALEKIYATQLHLLGAKVVDLNIQPLKPSQLACLNPEERGKAEFTLEGWLLSIKKGPQRAR